MGNPLIEARDLIYAVGQRKLIDGVNCRIEPGRRTMLLGANGAGKSLLLRLFHGLIAPTAGNLCWQGSDLSAEARARQSMVFQHPIMLRRSVRANLEFALHPLKLTKAQARNRVDEELENAGLTPIARRSARVLSGGEAQRLAIARALITRPELILLDEPTASLDPSATKAIETLILGAEARGVAVVMVTHSAGQARRLGQDVIFLHDGKVAEAGAAETILHSPTSNVARTWLEGGLAV